MPGWAGRLARRRRSPSGAASRATVLISGLPPAVKSLRTVSGEMALHPFRRERGRFQKPPCPLDGGQAAGFRRHQHGQVLRVVELLPVARRHESSKLGA